MSPALSGGDESVLAALILCVSLSAINLAIAWATSGSERLGKLVEGQPVLVGAEGKFFDEVLRKQHVPVSDLEQALREADCEREEMRCAILDADGKISILKNRSVKPP